MIRTIRLVFHVERLKHWPAPHFDKRGQPDPPDLPDDFAETISADIEDTRRDLRALNLKQGGSRAERELESLRQKLLDQALGEIADLRAVVAKHNEAIKGKASKKAMDDFAKSLTEKIEKRLDTIRNLVLAAVTIIGAFLAWLKVKG